MANKLFNTNDILEIANALREVYEDSRTYKVREMAPAIRNLKPKPYKNIDVSIINGTWTGPDKIYEGNTATITLKATAPAILPDDVTVMNAEYNYDKNTGILVLRDATDDVRVEAECSVPFTITTNVTNGTYDGETEVLPGQSAFVNIHADSGFNLPDNITVSGALYEWDKTTGVVEIHDATGNVTISVTCTSDWWDDVSHFTTLDVGHTEKVTVNGKEHTVRLIGIDKDTIAGSSDKAHTTWEFVDLISDEDGYSLATYWKNTNDTSTANFDYLNSDIRKALDGQGSGSIHWFEKDSKNFSTTYTNSVIDMLPSALVSKMKTVSKVVNEKTTGSWVETSYDTNLFLLTPKEMGYSASYMESGVTTYDYYVGKTAQTDASRIKAQVMGSTGARTEALSGTDVEGAYTSTKYSYAGYNSSTSGQGGIYWLRSPRTNGTDRAWYVYHSGNVNHSSVYYYAYGVSPCFCI